MVLAHGAPSPDLLEPLQHLPAVVAFGKNCRCRSWMSLMSCLMMLSQKLASLLQLLQPLPSRPSQERPHLQYQCSRVSDLEALLVPSLLHGSPRRHVPLLLKQGASKKNA